MVQSECYVARSSRNYMDVMLSALWFGALHPGAQNTLHEHYKIEFCFDSNMYAFHLWLTSHVCISFMAYISSIFHLLDVVSLCRCAQVCKVNVGSN